LLCSSLLALCASASLFKKDHHNGIKEFVINLDLPPEERYNEVLKAKYAETKELFEMFKSFISKFTRIALYINQMIYSYSKSLLPEEYVNEIKGVGVALDMSEEDAFLGNIIYELGSRCTSIVAQNKEGQVFLARNLDYRFASYLAKAHYIGVYKRNGRELFRCSSIAGYVGSLTCVKRKSFAISINHRTTSIVSGYIANIVLLAQGVSSPTWLLRSIMQNIDTFEEAEQLLKSTQLPSPVYFTIAGTQENQGSVITRDRTGIYEYRKLGPSPKGEIWYLVQTNSDNWLYNDERTKKSIELMNKIGQENVTKEKIFNDVLQEYPVKNKKTILTASMDPVKGELEVALGVEI